MRGLSPPLIRLRFAPAPSPTREEGKNPPPHARTSLCDLLCDCPTGKSPKTCPALAQKIFRFAPAPNHPYNSRHPAPTRGAYRDRHGRWVRGAVAAARRARNKSLQGELAHERRPRADERRDCGRQSRVVLAPVAGVKPAEMLRAQPGFARSSIRRRRRQEEFVSGESTV